ncbi:lipopolysaccharide biosynthesis protein [Herbiconiux moechotypicola]|uniref:Lipopolysaccharide biosynthesis protein n=1 Tax=Herbiconiux moechotypicola TaxID=637393 RepID=A0ABP5QMU2_9MICO
MGAQVLRIGIQFLGIVLLARLLTPEAYGLVAMVTAIIGIGEVFRDFGLSMAAVQSKTLSKHERDNLFWTNTAIGLVLTTIVYFCAPLVASFYGEPSLLPITQVLSLTFLLNGLSTQYRANLSRGLSFFKLNLSEILGQAVGLGAGVAVALAGYGFWALVAQQVAQALFAFIFLIIMSPWLPGWIHRDAPITRFVGFGLNLAGTQLLTYVSKNINSVIIGSTLGATPLGLYNRAFQLLTLPLNQINAPATRVALPVLSRLQDEKERFAAFILRGQVILLHLVSFIFAFSSALAVPLIALVLGNQWLGAAPIFQILAVGGVFQAASYACYWVFLAKGLTRQNLYYSLVSRVTMIGLIVVGAIWGLYGVSWAYSIGIVLFWPVGLWWISRVSDAPAKAMFTNGARAIAVYGAAGLATFFIVSLIPDLVPIADVGIGLVIMLLVLAVIYACWPAYRRDASGLVHTASLLRKRRRSSDTP